MFSRTRRAYQAVNENQRHKQVKEQLTQQFHRSLKSLQQKEHVDGATIVSNEASNNLCSVLEAIFLHGVKDNMMSKLVSYAQGVNSEVKLNFWNVVKKFTHKDVVVQLKGLSQINSDIGLCRAWVRLAINDGLVASYLASMMADTNAMQTFYHHWAYMLDYEQPDILRNHLTGLMGLNFLLSLNSSILNTWSTTTITMAAMATESLSLAAVVPPGAATPSSSRRDSQGSVTSTDSLSAATGSTSGTVTTGGAAAAAAAVAASVAAADRLLVAAVTSTPPNTPADPSFFNNVHDADILKSFGGGLRSSSVSSSSSGQASCPDPGESYEAGGGRFSSRSSRSNSPLPSPYDSLRHMTREDRKMEEEAKLKSILQRWDQRELEREQEEERRQIKEQKRKEHERQKREAEEEKRIQEELKQKKREESERAKNNSQKQPVEGNGEAKADEKGQNATHCKPSVKTEDQPSVKTEDQPSVKTDGQPLVKNSDSLPSKPVDSSVEEAVSALEEYQHKDSVDSTLAQGQEGEEEEDDDEWRERESSYGNSLNAMDGWSTSSPYPHHHYDPSHLQRHDHLQQQTTFDQSYETLLKGYHAQQGGEAGIAPVQKVLDNLPDNGHASKKRQDWEKPSERSSAMDESDDDIDFTDYEIINSPEEASDVAKLEQMKSLCNYMGKNNQGNMCATPSCNMGVGFFHGPGQVCSFDGRTYCEQCHQSRTAYIPAEIVFNWNFRKSKVCEENFSFLQRVHDQPVLDVEEMSSKLYTLVPVMNNVMRLRTQLTSLRSYMFTCSESTASQLKDRVWPREHLYNKVHTYSVNDLLEARSGKLETFLKEMVTMCTKHIYTCTLCMAKGFYCELCQDRTPIFPFQINTTVKCQTCKNVYHTHCKTDFIPCPKCVRYSKRGMRRQNDDDDDYACSPDL